MGSVGVKTISGLKIMFISSENDISTILNKENASGIDILLTNDWPEKVTENIE